MTTLLSRFFFAKRKTARSKTYEGLGHFGESYVKVLSPKDYTRLYERSPERIIDAKVIPAVPGRRGFGKIEVTLRATPFENA